MKSSNTSEKAIETPYGMTVPLLTTSSGEKYGKSAGNAIWISEQELSSFNLHQVFCPPNKPIYKHTTYLTHCIAVPPQDSRRLG